MADIKDVKVTISGVSMNGETYFKLLRLIKKHEPKIWDEIKDTVFDSIDSAAAKADARTDGLHLHSVVVRLFDPKKNKPKPSKDDITFSEDVCIIDENNVHGVAYFCFESMQWRFHTDTLVDYDEIGAETKWYWYYPPVSAETIKF